MGGTEYTVGRRELNQASTPLDNLGKRAEMTILFLNRIYKISTKAVQLIDPNVKVEFYKLRRDH